ncbi:MAG: hypothetical protein ACE5MK_13495 [Acidobacteriota bacterium]
MKRTIFISLICALGLSACAPSMPHLSRQDLLQRLASMRNLEAKYDEIQTYASLADIMGVGVTEYQARKLKEHTDLYWLHYYAANVAIANGDVQGYEIQLQTSRAELEAIEDIFDDVIRRLQHGQLRLERVPPQML